MGCSRSPNGPELFDGRPRRAARAGGRRCGWTWRHCAPRPAPACCRRMLCELVRRPARRERDAAGSLARQLAGVPEAEREAIVRQLVRAQVASVLGHDSPQAIDAQQAFKELGFDSLSAVELRNRLARATGLRLPSTLIFDYPNSAALAGYLMRKAIPATAHRRKRRRGRVGDPPGARLDPDRAPARDGPVRATGEACERRRRRHPRPPRRTTPRSTRWTPTPWFA